MRRIVLIPLAFLALATPAAAAEVEVTGSEESGLGEAIVLAEAGDTIVIPEGTTSSRRATSSRRRTSRSKAPAPMSPRSSRREAATRSTTRASPSIRDATVAPAQELSEAEAAAEEDDDSSSDGIETKAQIIALIVTFGILLLVLDLVRRRRLSERYAIIWMTAAFALLVLSIWTGGLDAIADLMGIQEPANAIFIIAFAVGFLLLLNFSVVSSRLNEESKVLAQEVARLEQELRHERSLRGGEENGFSGRAAADERQDDPPVRAE